MILSAYLYLKYFFLDQKEAEELSVQYRAGKS